MILILLAAGLHVASAGCGPEKGSPEAEAARMRALVARLAHASPHEVRVMAELRLWETKAEPWVRTAILDEGAKAVPYLIEGLSDDDENVRLECTQLLGRLPNREGIEALLACLDGSVSPAPPSWAVHRTLHRMTGHGPYFAPDPEEAASLWRDWWEAHRLRLVEEGGAIGLRQDDGSIVPLPVEEEAAAPEEPATE